MSILADWDAIDWAQVQARVTIHQNRIYKASLNREHGKMHRLQKLLIRSISGKLLAVRLVTTDNRGINTPGIDGKIVTRSAQKLELAKALSLSGKAMKIRRVCISKPDKREKRPLGISIIEDRANQALAKMALEPQWEAHFEPNSYGFRPGRNAQDAVEAIFQTLSRGARKYVLDADIFKCFDTINHESLLEKLETYPEMRIQIRAWLKAGLMTQDGYDPWSSNQSIPRLLVEETVSVAPLSKTEWSPCSFKQGIPEGGIISPLLANIALHGMEDAINERFSKDQLKVSVIRYANDFVAIHRSKEAVEASRDFISDWLTHIGLELSPSKTRFICSSEGFNFLGFHFIHVGKDGHLKTKITPSKASQKRLLTDLKDQAAALKGNAAHVLIRRLTSNIVGWGNYFRTSECSDVFRSMDHRIYQLLRPWVFRRHPTWGRQKIKEKYFPEGRSWFYQCEPHHSNWVLSDSITKPSGEVVMHYLPKLAWIASKKHVKVQGVRSPFDGDIIYWSLRLSNYSPLGTTATKLLKAQNCICSRCKTRFIITDVVDIDYIVPVSKSGKSTIANKQLLHKHCHAPKTKDDLKIQ